MIFIFFNGGGLSYDQWFKHPYDEKTTDIVEKINKLGKVFMYNPVFYINENDVEQFQKSENEYIFKMKDLDLVKHCKKINDMVKNYDNYFLISHSRGWIVADVFMSMYGSKISGYINLDGGETRESASRRVAEWPLEYGMVNDEQLLQYFNEIKNNINVEKNLVILGKIGKYHVYKQYSEIINLVQNTFPIYILNNIYNDDEVNIKMQDYVATTLLEKIEYNAEFKENKNIHSIWYVGFTHYFYFEKTDEIIEIINKVLNECKNIHKKQLYLVRHGETEWNALGLLQGGSNDTELNENGKLQSLKTGNYLKTKTVEDNFDLILCSPLKRAKQTAEIIADCIGYDKSKIIYMDELKEEDAGLTANGKTDKELREDPFFDDFFSELDNFYGLDRIDQLERNHEYPEIFMTKYKMESKKSVIDRCQYVIDFIKKCPNKKILIVGHSGSIDWFNRIILNTAEFIKGDFSGGKNCFVTYYTIQNCKFRLIMAPSTTHLK